MVTKQNGIYRLSVFCDETVPPFGPTLPNPPDFQVTYGLRNEVTHFSLTLAFFFLGLVAFAISPWIVRRLKSLFERKHITQSNSIRLRAIENHERNMRYMTMSFYDFFFKCLVVFVSCVCNSMCFSLVFFVWFNLISRQCILFI